MNKKTKEVSFVSLLSAILNITLYPWQKALKTHLKSIWMTQNLLFIFFLSKFKTKAPPPHSHSLLFTNLQRKNYDKLHFQFQCQETLIILNGCAGDRSNHNVSINMTEYSAATHTIITCNNSGKNFRSESKNDIVSTKSNKRTEKKRDSETCFLLFHGQKCVVINFWEENKNNADSLAHARTCSNDG